MTICRVLLLINGQNDKNPKSLHPIVASICKVMAVKNPCVHGYIVIKAGSLVRILNNAKYILQTLITELNFP